MPTYEFSQGELGDLIEQSPVFNSEDQAAILAALQNAGVFNSGGAGGTDATTTVVDPNNIPPGGFEVVVVNGAPEGGAEVSAFAKTASAGGTPVDLPSGNTAYIFNTDDAVNATMHGGGNHVIVTGGGDDSFTSSGSSK